MLSTPEKPVVLYDVDCGFCRWSLKWVEKWDRGNTLLSLPIQSTEGKRLLAEVPADLRLDSWHFVDADGVVFSAGAAFAPMLKKLPGAKPLARLAELMPGLTEAGYRFVSSRRSFFGRMVRRFGTVPPPPPLD